MGSEGMWESGCEGQMGTVAVMGMWESGCEGQMGTVAVRGVREWMRGLDGHWQ